MNEQKVLPLVALKNIVLLPKSIIPVVVGRQLSIKAIEQALTTNDRKICIVAQKKIQDENPLQDDLYLIGTYATILQAMKMPKGTYKLLIEGIDRFKISSFKEDEDNVFAIGSILETIIPDPSSQFEALWRTLQETYAEYSKYYDKNPQHLLSDKLEPREAEIVLDTLISQLDFDISQKQILLEEISLIERIQKVLLILGTELDILQTEERIKTTIQTQIESTQREYYLHEQLKAIQKELKKERSDDAIDEYRKKLKEASLTEEAYDKCEKEITRLEQMQAFSSEASVSRNYIEWILSLPWKKKSKDNHSISKAKEILDQDHFGLLKPKERILEFIAAKKYAKDLSRNPVICLVGPPGVGKTSLAYSIAKSLNKEFIKIALGGVKDEAEIRGHRRTYVASMPGRIIQGMKKAKTVNPVFLLDEIDKMSSDVHGDPAAAMLEVLDLEQNREFLDNFLEIPYDLSQVMFIATANHADMIPYALADRMELIFLSGYTQKEKFEIAKKFLLPKIFKDHSLTSKECIITDAAIKKTIDEYTRESGIRNLERLLTRTIRKVIQTLLSSKSKLTVVIDEAEIVQFFKSSPYKLKPIDQKPKVGISSGLAWTELGGDVLEVEVVLSPGKGNVTLTGQLGEVMQESAQTALSYIRSKSTELQINKKFFTEYDIHVHVPEGATPKDGPSAGITMGLALASALTKIPIKPYIAMTGEITLQGRVLAVGGLKEKFLAAFTYGFKEIIIPAEHKEIALEAQEELGNDHISLYFVETMDQVLVYGLVDNPFVGKEKKSTRSLLLKTKKNQKTRKVKS